MPDAPVAAPAPLDADVAETEAGIQRQPSLLQRFGSRNHPKTVERKARMQKARAGMQATPELLANYTAVRAFLYGEWFGALACCASVALVYMFASPSSTAQPPWSLLVPLAVFAIGVYVYWRNRVYYERLGFPWAKRWHHAALILAGSGVIFWLLFGALYWMATQGIPVMPLK